MRRVMLALAASIAAMFATSTFAQSPVALVEEVRSTTAGVEFMDYVSAGTRIRLRAQDTIVLGYFASCVSEAIIGGVVTVGTTQSDVQGGKVARTKVMCEGNIALTESQAKQSAGTSFRENDELVRLHGRSPFVDAPGGAALLVVRLDVLGEFHVATLPVKPGRRRSHFDFAAENKLLTPGGVYRASIGARRIDFRIEPDAKAGRLPIISRLLRFAPRAEPAGAPR
jgi:hypothetical protein